MHSTQAQTHGHVTKKNQKKLTILCTLTIHYSMHTHTCTQTQTQTQTHSHEVNAHIQTHSLVYSLVT